MSLLSWTYEGSDAARASTDGGRQHALSGDAVYDDELGAGLIDMRECARREVGECDGAREQRRRGERCREHTAAPLEGWRGGLTVPENRC